MKILLMASCALCTTSFVTISSRLGRSQPPAFAVDYFKLRASNDGIFDPPSDNIERLGPLELTNDFDSFLNQCAIQSLISLMASLKGRHTARWLEDFTQPVIRTQTQSRSKEDQVLRNMADAMTRAMKDTHEMDQKIQLLTYHGLGAMNMTLFPTWGSYFEKLLGMKSVLYLVESNQPHIPTYEMEINPASICTRLISVREQIAREFAHDLDALIEISSTMLSRYRQRRKEHPEDNSMEKNNLLFLEMSVVQDYKPSPLRTGNFDLLTLLATQEAIHRVLKSPEDSVKEPAQYLLNFYVRRIRTHFTGRTRYGRADDFVEELLTSPPAVTQLQNGESGLVDPTRVAEILLKEREVVAEEWLERALDVPLLHTDIKRLQLKQLMDHHNNRPDPQNGSGGSFE